MSDEKRPVIAFTKNSPYMVIDVKEIENPDGKILPLETVTSLCRCGESLNKPFCDGTHLNEGIPGEKHPDRDPYKWKDYRGKDITVHYNLGVCCHDGSCVKMLPEVFNANCRPWIIPDKGKVDAIINTIRHCPSGALSYTLNGKKYVDFHPFVPKIKVMKKGPLQFCGGIILKDDQESKPETYDHYTLCRCGFSKNKPFCDGKHVKNKFQD